MRARARVPLVCAALALLAFSSYTAVERWRGERAFTRAQEEQKRGNINGARDLYEKALGRGVARAALPLARTAYLRGDVGAVERYARLSAALDPTAGDLHVYVAHARAAAGAVDGPAGVEHILAPCRKAVALEPTNISLGRSCGDLALHVYLREAAGWDEGEEKKRYREEALDYYRRVLESAPGNDRVWYALGEGAERMNDLETAAAAYGRAARLKSRNAVYREALARVEEER